MTTCLNLLLQYVRTVDWAFLFVSVIAMMSVGVHMPDHLDPQPDLTSDAVSDKLHIKNAIAAFAMMFLSA